VISDDTVILKKLMRPIVKVDSISKRYTVGVRDAAYDTLRESIVGAARAPLKRLLGRNGNSPSETLWALKDVSFVVEPGDVLGIIGRNGAGKSTLLKVLSRITEPSSGTIELFGRVGSLLEVGTGFHPELTGRENIYLNGAILGMQRAETESKFDEIVAFSELERFLDTPVKRYSSGMYMRLAFAVAAHLEPEILVVDEVLAVGDVAFQKKCLGKIGQVAKEGRTVLFVSHNMTAVRSLCNRALWLDHGKVVDAGKTEQVVLHYLQKEAHPMLERQWDDADAPSGDGARLRRISITPFDQELHDAITVKTALKFEAEFWNYVPDAVLNFSVVIYNLEGLAIFNTGSQAQAFPEGLIRGSFLIPKDFLNDGTYTVRLLIVKDTAVGLIDLHDLLVFEVLDSERTGNWYGKVIGAVRPRFDWELFVEN
jgi:lipopolysaccharide transport system ATP-binding protein